MTPVSLDGPSLLHADFLNIGWSLLMRLIRFIALGLLGSLALMGSIDAARAAKAVASGHPLQLYHVSATNPDCTSAGPVVLRVLQGPEHGRVTIRRAGVFPNFPESNIRSVCNRRRVQGMEAIYVSQPGYMGSDLVVMEAIGPAGRDIRVIIPVQVM